MNLRFELSSIGYLSEPTTQYAKELWLAVTLDDFRGFAHKWEPLAPETKKIVSAMTNEEFKEFRVGLRKERKKEFAGEAFYKKYKAVMMPDVLFAVSYTSVNFNAPWGTCYLRMRQFGKIIVDNGIAYLAKDKK